MQTVITYKHGNNKVTKAKITLAKSTGVMSPANESIATLQSVDNQPSHITYFVEPGDTQGAVSTQTWHKDGRLHNTTGPAYISYTRTGEVSRQLYYYNGENIQSMIDSGQLIVNDDGTLPEDSMFTLEMMG